MASPNLWPLSITSESSHAPCLRCCRAVAWSRGSQRADALSETSHTRARRAEQGGRVPRALRQAALSEKTSMCGGGCAIMPVDVAARVVGQRGRAGQASRPWHNTLELI